MLLRYITITLIFIFWKQIVNYVDNFQHWDNKLKEQITNKKLHILLFVISFEIIVVHNLIGKFIFS